MFLVLTLLIGALVGLMVVAFIVVTERFGARLYPVGSAPWRRLLVPAAWIDDDGVFAVPIFPGCTRKRSTADEGGAYLREKGRSRSRTVFGKFFCTSATLACGIPLGREGPAVQVGGGIASVLGRALGLRPETGESADPGGSSSRSGSGI